MKHLLIPFFILLSINCFSQPQFEIGRGSTLISLISKDTIWIAADRRVSNKNAPQSETIKIRGNNNLYYGIAGNALIMSPYNKTDTIFSAFRSMDSIINYQKDLSKCFISFNDYAVSNLTAILQSMEIKFPKQFASLFQIEDDNFLEFFICSFRDNKKYFLSRQLYINGSIKNWSLSKRSADSSVDIKKVDSGGMLLQPMGQYNNLYNFLGLKNGYLNRNNIRQRMICLIEEEANKNEFVGMPADLLILSNNKAEWLYNNKACVIKE